MSNAETLCEITIPMLRAWGACYLISTDPQKVERLFAGRSLLTLHHVLALDIPAKDKLWVLVRCARHKDLVELYRWCSFVLHQSATTSYGLFINVHSVYGVSLRAARALAERHAASDCMTDLAEGSELLGIVHLLHQIMVAP